MTITYTILHIDKQARTALVDVHKGQLTVRRLVKLLPIGDMLQQINQLVQDTQFIEFV